MQGSASLREEDTYDAILDFLLPPLLDVVAVARVRRKGVAVGVGEISSSRVHLLPRLVVVVDVAGGGGQGGDEGSA